jgi:4-carboxymuconolactone decarboxylase
VRGARRGASGKTEQMGFHSPRAIDNGVTANELVGLVTHLAFCAGWPNAPSAVTQQRQLGLSATKESP